MLPPPVASSALPRYRPTSRHFSAQSFIAESDESTPVAGHSATVDMEASNRHSTSPEDCSEGNETLSAPSEFLAEFLSSIMRRQYAEALKYCRLILQYEPHNATARGFFPLLQHKVRQALADEAVDSEDGASCGSQSSLELDSSASLSLSRRSERTSSASAASRSDADDNGNVTTPPLTGSTAAAAAADVRNDNAPDTAHKSEPALAGASLQRLRAHFACSIK